MDFHKILAANQHFSDQNVENFYDSNIAFISVVARQLAKGTMGYLTWTGGSLSAMSSVIVRNTEKYHFMAQLQVWKT